ncbi:MAG: hypothetical protein HS130_04180 [Deltaproteobacteria bacterium]|nr:hypothetical protein [Deltaproteobacteria bacterium]
MRLAVLFLSILLLFSSEAFAEEICVERGEAGGALTAEGFEAFKTNPEYIELSPEDAAKGRDLLKSKGIGSQPLLLPSGAGSREAGSIEYRRNACYGALCPLTRPTGCASSKVAPERSFKP